MNYCERYSVLPLGVSWQLQGWLDQCRKDPQFGPSRWPEPNDLCALAEYASALVMNEGIVYGYLGRPLQSGIIVVPEWALAGEADAYNFTETVLGNLSSSEIWDSLPMKQRQYMETFYIYNVSFATKLINYIAWECYCARISESNAAVMPLCDSGYILSRALLESSRPTIKDMFERPFSSIMLNLEEIQLPLILSVAISRIDRPYQLIPELHSMREEMGKIKNIIADIEVVISNPTTIGSGKKIRLLRNDFERTVRKAAGDLCSSPSLFENVAGLLSLDPLSALGNFFKGGVHKSLWNSLMRHELRLLSRWTEQCASDTVKKLKILFKTKGTDHEWKLAAKTLQIHGTVAWYPLRRSFINEHEH